MPQTSKNPQVTYKRAKIIALQNKRGGQNVKGAKISISKDVPVFGSFLTQKLITKSRKI
jgi:hypothetical protein